MYSLLFRRADGAEAHEEPGMEMFLKGTWGQLERKQRTEQRSGCPSEAGLGAYLRSQERM